MSKYQSVATAIQLVEAAANIVGNGLIAEGKTGEIIRDLRDIAKDVRYGGELNGDYESIAQALEYCTEINTTCSVCPYRKEMACRRQLKRDAMHAIREMGARLKEQQAEIERLIKEKQRVIDQIENEINRLQKESSNVKDEVGTATYEWLINGFQVSLDMIKDNGQELVNKERK